MDTARSDRDAAFISGLRQAWAEAEADDASPDLAVERVDGEGRVDGQGRAEARGPDAADGRGAQLRAGGSDTPSEVNSSEAGNARRASPSLDAEERSERDRKVLKMVRRQLRRDPPPSTEAIYGRAARIHSSIYRMDLRQFHAKYVLRVRREQARASRRREAETTGEAMENGASAENGTAARTEIREVLVDMARAMTVGNGAGVVDVVAGMDEYVDRVEGVLEEEVPAGG